MKKNNGNRKEQKTKASAVKKTKATQFSIHSGEDGSRTMEIQNSDLQIRSVGRRESEIGPTFSTLPGGADCDGTSLHQVGWVLEDAAICHVTMTFHIAVHAAWHQRQLPPPSFFELAFVLFDWRCLCFCTCSS